MSTSARVTSGASRSTTGAAALALNDLGVVSGYTSVPPCDNQMGIPCFKPYNNFTRGQISKILSLILGYYEVHTNQTYEDVPSNSTFYQYAERLSARGVVGGYECGGPGESCVFPNNRRYFRPSSHATRGQFSKMVSESFGYPEYQPNQHFEDVPIGSTFHQYIERLFTRGFINGYACGGLGEPCVSPSNRPYFRPSSNITRGQTVKIVYSAYQSLAPTPTHTPTTTPTTITTSLPSPSETSTAGPSSTPWLTYTPTVTLTPDPNSPTATTTGTPSIKQK